MRVTVDTNILVRAAVRDDARQAALAGELLRRADLVAITSACFCEFVWVLRRLYKFDNDKIVTAIDALLDAENVVLDRPAVEAGLAALSAGGDFADGLIAHEGRRLGGATFASFDRKAVALVTSHGGEAQLLA